MKEQASDVIQWLYMTQFSVYILRYYFFSCN